MDYNSIFAICTVVCACTITICTTIYRVIRKGNNFMTQEDKELLLKDLCARLPYHPIVYVDENLPRLKLGVATRVWEYTAVDKPCKPYLRSMSSMTEEEVKELYILLSRVERLGFPDIYKGQNAISSLYDWLNANHFDYHTIYDEDKKKYMSMIEKGLAIEVTEKNNPYKE